MRRGKSLQKKFHALFPTRNFSSWWWNFSKKKNEIYWTHMMFSCLISSKWIVRRTSATYERKFRLSLILWYASHKRASTDIPPHNHMSQSHNHMSPFQFASFEVMLSLGAKECKTLVIPLNVMSSPLIERVDANALFNF